MKRRTIKTILNRKFNRFLNSIKDDEVRKLVDNNTIITGGAITSLLLNEKVNDFDLYFKDRDTVEAVAGYYVKQFLKDYKGELSDHIRLDTTGDRVRVVVQSAGVAHVDGEDGGYSYFELGDPSSTDVEEYIDAAVKVSKKKEDKKARRNFEPLFLSGNSITLANDVQLVIRFWGTPEEIHDNYDFVHCMNYWDSETGELHLNPLALEAILNKQLIYHGSKYPIASIIRSRKFIERGWTITAGEYLKMVFQCQDLDLLSPDVLIDQLMGVDMAYFVELIRAISEGEQERLDRSYVMQLIDNLLW